MRRIKIISIPGRHGGTADSIFGGRKEIPGPGNYNTNKSTLDNHALTKYQ